MAEVIAVASMTASVSHNIQPDAVGVGKVFSVCRMSGGLHVDLRGARRRSDPQQPGPHHHPRDVRQRQSPWGRRLARTHRRARRQQIIGLGGNRARNVDGRPSRRLLRRNLLPLRRGLQLRRLRLHQFDDVVHHHRPIDGVIRFSASVDHMPPVAAAGYAKVGHQRFTRPVYHASDDRQRQRISMCPSRSSSVRTVSITLYPWRAQDGQEITSPHDAGSPASSAYPSRPEPLPPVRPTGTRAEYPRSPPTTATPARLRTSPSPSAGHRPR